MKVLGAVAGRRFMRSWLETSLDNLKYALAIREGLEAWRGEGCCVAYDDCCA